MKTKKRKIMGWTFVIPASIMIVIFNFVPMIQSFILSLKRGSGTNMTFTGLSNYKRMFQDKIFKMTLSNTFIYLILEVAIMLVIAMFLASLLNDKRLKGKWFFVLQFSYHVLLPWYRIPLFFVLFSLWTDSSIRFLRICI